MSEEKKKTTSIRIDEETDEVISAIAQAAGVTKGDAVKYALKWLLSREERDEEKFDRTMDRYERLKARTSLFMRDSPISDITTRAFDMMLAQKTFEMLGKNAKMDFDDIVKMMFAMQLVPRRDGSENLELRLRELEDKMKEYVETSIDRLVADLQNGLLQRIDNLQQTFAGEIARIKEVIEKVPKEAEEGKKKEEESLLVRLLDELRGKVESLEEKFTKKEIEDLRKEVRDLRDKLAQAVMQPKPGGKSATDILDELQQSLDKLKQIQTQVMGTPTVSPESPESVKEKEVMKKKDLLKKGERFLIKLR